MIWSIALRDFDVLLINKIEVVKGRSLSPERRKGSYRPDCSSVGCKEPPGCSGPSACNKTTGYGEVLCSERNNLIFLIS